MTISYFSIIQWSWAAFLLVWALSSLTVKRDIRGRGLTSVLSRFYLVRLAGLLLIAFVLVRIYTGTAHYSAGEPILFTHIAGFPDALGWCGAACVVVGIAIAFWARYHLGRNWSGTPAAKEQHELVTSGPYAWVRHPIYTGVLLAALGTALGGIPVGFVAPIITGFIFFRRFDTEEAIMLQLFPNEYPAYQARTKRLIPYVW